MRNALLIPHTPLAISTATAFFSQMALAVIMNAYLVTSGRQSYR
jgi:hypothetical protein